MTEDPVLIETSFADAVAIIAAAQELPEQKRRKPLEVIPARYSAVRADLIQLHEVPAGLTSKTLQNHKSNAKGALLWLAREKGIPEHGAPLSDAWEVLRAEIKDGLARSRLSSFMRYCSANSVARPRLTKPPSIISSIIAHAAASLPTLPSGVCSPERGMATSGLFPDGRRSSWSNRLSRLPSKLNGKHSPKVSGKTSINTSGD